MPTGFFRNSRGSVLVAFALAAPMLIGAVGWMVDFSQAISARSGMQSAVDAAAQAVLADLQTASQKSLTPDSIVTDINKQSRAQSVVTASMADYSGLGSPTVIVTTTASTFTVASSATITTPVMAALGLSGYPLSAQSTVAWNYSDQLQIALALDSSNPSATTVAFVKLGVLALVPTYYFSSGIVGSTPNITMPNVAFSLVPFNSQVRADIAMADSGDAAGHGGTQTLVAGLTLDPEAAGARTSIGFRNILDQLLPGPAMAAPPRVQLPETSLMEPAATATAMCYQDVATSVPTKLGDLPLIGSKVSVPCEYQAHSAALPMTALPKYDPSKGWSGFLSGLASSFSILKGVNSVQSGGCLNMTVGLASAFAQLPKDKNPKTIVLLPSGHNSRNGAVTTPECGVNGATGGATGKLIAANDANNATGNEAGLDARAQAACAILSDPTKNGGLKVNILTIRLVNGRINLLKACASPTASGGTGGVGFLNATTSTAISSNISSVATVQFKQRAVPKQSGEAESEH